jgi:uncharacterized membrane protein (UPF0127 family)
MQSLWIIGASLLLLSCSSIAPALSPIPNSSPASSTLQKSMTATEQLQETVQGQALPITAQVKVAGHIIQLEVAQTPEQQEMGLMYRTHLAKNRGMLFPFSPPQSVKFWMRNTLIPLDMVFLYQGKVRAVSAQVSPCDQAACPTYGPDEPSDQVIELPSGRAAELGIQVGDLLSVEYLKNPPLP